MTRVSTVQPRVSIWVLCTLCTLPVSAALAQAEIDAADAPVAAELNLLPALDPNLPLDPTAPAMPHQPNATP